MDFFDFTQPASSEYQVRYPLNGRLYRWVLRPDFSLDRGYLHLIEHVVVLANSGTIQSLEREGGYYNATTNLDEMSLIARTPHSDGRIDAVRFTEAPWTEGDFESARRTIRQERLLKQGLSNESTEVDAIIGSLADIDNFSYGKLMSYREVVRGNWTTLSYGQYVGSTAFYHPIGTSSPFCDSSSDTPSLGAMRSTPEDPLIQFFLRMVEMAAPAPKPWAIGDGTQSRSRAIQDGAARRYIDRHKSALLLRYCLRLQNVMFFDQEFNAYLATGLGPLDVGSAFESTDWQEALS